MGCLEKGAVSHIYRSLIINAPDQFPALHLAEVGEMGGRTGQQRLDHGKNGLRELAISALLRMVHTNYLHLSYLSPQRM